MSGPKQYLTTMEEVFRYVNTEWTACGQAIAGERGFSAVHVQSTYASAADQRVRRAFRDILSRKTKAREGAVDQAPVVATVSEEGKREETQLVQHQQDQQQEQGSASNGATRLGLWSIAYLGGTGDFNFVQNPKAFKDLPALPSSSCDAEAGVKESSGLSGRAWFSTLLLFDEIYDFLMELGILDTPASASKKQGSGTDTSGQTPNSGWANRLLQSGISAYETKTCGCFGGLHTPTINTSLAGNFHPGVAVEMLRGLRGDHGCQTKARCFFISGPPIQPHQEYESFGIRAKVEYCCFPDILKPLLALECLDSPEESAKKFGHEGDLQDGSAVFTDSGFFPSEDGWNYVLPDGDATHIRFRKTEDGTAIAEWSMAVRDIDVPEEFSIPRAAERLASFFAHDHMEMEFTTEANQLFKSYCTYFNILVAEARSEQDIGLGAQMGACPWKLGMLSGALMMWDISWEQADVPVSPTGGIIKIPASVVARAFGLLEILESIVAIMAGRGASSAFSSVHAAAEAARKKDASDEDALTAMLAETKPDGNWEPRAQHTGILDTVFFRRLLTKGERSKEDGEVYIVRSRSVYNVQRNKDTVERSLTLADFRTLAKAVPSLLGQFDAPTDSLRFRLPLEPDTEYEDLLVKCANITSEALRSLLQECAAQKKKGKKRTRAQEGED
ncbi:unnamed protein product [Effrenium voratum]|nr:unnamed protein product [Effrenium voratum]